MTLTATAPRNPYLEQQVLSATPARLLTMLYDRLLLDLHCAEEAQKAENWLVASSQLLHAQEIVSELNSSLVDGVWDGAEGLRATYIYVGNALMSANIQRNASLIREAIDLLEPLRQAWHEAAALPANHGQDGAAHVG